MSDDAKADAVAGDRIAKIRHWFKNPYNLALFCVLVLAAAIRIYFLFNTAAQPLWYDEAEYMSTAKKWGLGTPYNPSPHRPPLFQLLGAFGFMFGFAEIFIKFLIVVLPSFALVYCIYLLGKEMYDEKVGLIAALLASVSWTWVFWSARFQPDFASMTFQVLAVLFMWKYWKNEKMKFIILAGLFTALGFMFKLSALLVPMSFMAFIAIKDRLYAFKNKDYYIYSISFLAPLIPYFIWAKFYFGTAAAFSQGYGVSTQLGFGWYVLKFLLFKSESNPQGLFPSMIIFILFVLGLILALKFLLYADVLVKDRKKCFDPGLFNVVTIVVVAAWYIFWIRAAEDRWVFLWMPFIFIMVGNASMFIYNYGKKYSKIISIILVLGLLAWGSYAQFSHGRDLIESKKESYGPVKEAALWMRERSEQSDKIFSVSYPQTSYYSERDVLTSADIEGISSAEEFNDFIQKEKPKFVELSIFETHEPWMYQWPEGRNDTVPVQVYFADAEKKQPALIVYEINYPEIKEILSQSPQLQNITQGVDDG